MAGFIRAYHLTVEGGTFSLLSSSSLDLVDPTVPISTEVVLTEHQIRGSFKTSLKSTSSSTANYDILEIMNPSQQVIDLVNQVGANIKLKAGYLSDLPTDDKSQLLDIYHGDVIESKLVRTSQDFRLTLSCTPNFKLKTNLFISEVYTSGEKIENIFNQIASLADLTAVVDLGDLDSELTLLKRDYTVNGYLTNVLDILCNMLSLGWFTHLGTLFILPLGKEVSKAHYPSVIESPTQSTKVLTTVSSSDIKGEIDLTTTQDNSLSTYTKEDTPLALQKPKGKSYAGKEVEFTVFLNPRIKVGSVLDLSTEKIEGTFTIETVVHKLDYFGGTWDTTITAIGKV